MEEWRDVIGYEGLYQVCDIGLVRSLPTTKQYVDGRVRHNKGRILPLTHKDGYTMVRLHKSNDVKGRLFKVHVLVAKAFIDNPDNKPYIDHINTIRDDNRVENLRWCTAKENCNNPISLKKNKESTKKRFENPLERKKLSDAHKKWFESEENRKNFSEIMSRPDVRLRALENNPRKKSVRHYNSLGVLVGEYVSSNEAARKEGISQRQVSDYCLGKSMPRDKSIWFYIEDITPDSMTERILKITSTYSRVYVMQLTNDGKFIRYYSSMRNASKETGISETAICNATKGRSKTAGGYVWKTIV